MKLQMKFEKTQPSNLLGVCLNFLVPMVYSECIAEVCSTAAFDI